MEDGVLILHGVPGCGKSALWAAVANACVQDVRGKGDFVFSHVVDSAPGSNILEAMLKRLQVNLRSATSYLMNYSSVLPLIWDTTDKIIKKIRSLKVHNG